MISVCIATYNGSLYIKEQLQSLLLQLSISDEVLVADDGSTDNTVDVINAIGDPRIRLIAAGGNLGVVKNFERILLVAEGEYIFLCDQDDIWLPNKVTESISLLKNGVTLVVTDCRVVDCDLNVINSSFFELRKSGPGLFKNIWKNSYLGCCIAFNRILLARALPFPANIPMHDIWLGCIAEVYGSVKFLPKQLSLYRRHTCAKTPTGSKSQYSFYMKLGFRLNLIICLFSRILNSLWVMSRR